MPLDFSPLHTPVLHREIGQIFAARGWDDEVVIDATLGLGWHASLLLELQKTGIFLWFDRDEANLSRARSKLEGVSEGVKKYFFSRSFDRLSESLREVWASSIDFILYDLWVSSVHLDQWELGFSLRYDWPLDMRFDRSHGKTAGDLVMTLDAPALARIFTDYGEEKKSWFIAQAIVAYRKTHPIQRTSTLVEIIEKASFDTKSPLRVFQALRIAVNDEFAHIERSLESALELLAPGGMIAVITFHSLEDRLVKQFFAPYLEDVIDEVTGQIRDKSQFAKYSKKPIIPSEEEIQMNPRSRSAKLRIIKKIS